MSESHLTQKGIISHPSSTDKKMGVLAFHGRNGSPEAIEKLIHELGWQDQAYAIPRALNKTWYPYGFMAPLDQNKAQLDLAVESAKQHHKMLNDAGIADDQIVIMGFSQGACLAAHYALLHPVRYKAIAVLTGGYVGHQDIDWGFQGDLDQTPVYITTSEIDEWVPPSRAKETVEELKRLNADVTFKLFKDRPHSISEEEKDYLRNNIVPAN